MSISAGAGMNKIFASNPKTGPGFSGYIDVGLAPSKSSKKLFFFPAIELGTNSFLAPIEPDVLMNLSQTSLGLKMQVGFPLNESLKFKVGLFTSYIISTNVSIDYRLFGGGLSTFSNNEISKSYFPNKLQAGMLICLSKTIDKKENYALEFSVKQMANSILTRDYSFALFKNEEAVLFGKKSLPTFFSLGFIAKLGGNSDLK